MANVGKANALRAYDLEMTRARLDTTIDSVVMLLSTDWFLPYWSVIGVAAAEGKLCIQAGCRQIVQDLMNGASDYYGADFSEERLTTTRQSIYSLAKQCALVKSDEMKLTDLVESQPDREQFYKGAWLFRILAKKLVKDRELNAQTRAILEDATREQAVKDAVNFEQLCSESNSQWDKYVQSLTPDIPTSLANFLSVDLVSSQLLTNVLPQLTTAQQEQLLSIFRSVAKSDTGVDVDGDWRPV